jgi:hypothetical protein
MFISIGITWVKNNIELEFVSNTTLLNAMLSIFICLKETFKSPIHAMRSSWLNDFERILFLRTRIFLRPWSDYQFRRLKQEYDAFYSFTGKQLVQAVLYTHSMRETPFHSIHPDLVFSPDHMRDAIKLLGKMTLFWCYFDSYDHIFVSLNDFETSGSPFHSNVFVPTKVEAEDDNQVRFGYGYNVPDAEYPQPSSTLAVVSTDLSSLDILFAKKMALQLVLLTHKQKQELFSHFESLSHPNNTHWGFHIANPSSSPFTDTVAFQRLQKIEEARQKRLTFFISMLRFSLEQHDSDSDSDD